MIWRKNVERAKRTFFLGSGGEMHREWTGSLVETLPVVETDLLIQAILPRRLSNALSQVLAGFRQQIPRYIECMVRNVRTREAVIFVHFEDFITSVPNRTHYLESFGNSVEHNLNELRQKMEAVRTDQAAQAQCYESLFARNRFYVLGRRGFEYVFPHSPCSLESPDVEGRDQGPGQQPYFEDTLDPEDLI
jgi:hypothetical protein